MIKIKGVGCCLYLLLWAVESLRIEYRYSSYAFFIFIVYPFEELVDSKRSVLCMNI